MGSLVDASTDDLRRALETVEGRRPTQRLLAGIAYKNGVTQTELAEWHGVSRRTVYSWLDRLDADALPASVRDEPRSGRPRALSTAQRAELAETLRAPPTDAGLDDEAAWTTELVRRHVAATYGVEYSPSTCRRLLSEAGLTYRPGYQHTGAHGAWLPE